MSVLGVLRHPSSGQGGHRRRHCPAGRRGQNPVLGQAGAGGEQELIPKLSVAAGVMSVASMCPVTYERTRSHGARTGWDPHGPRVRISRWHLRSIDCGPDGEGR